MAFEDLTGASKFIDDFVITNPVGPTDQETQGDDHIAGIKNVILNTFPNITGPVTIDQNQINGAVFWASGTDMVFYQAAAPTGWTQNTSAGLNDNALRLVSGAGAGTGGATSVFTGVANTDTHTLTLAEIPTHSHSSSGDAVTLITTTGFGVATLWINTTSTATGSVGSGGSHSHGLSFTPKYVDVIICAKD